MNSRFNSEKRIWNLLVTPIRYLNGGNISCRSKSKIYLYSRPLTTKRPITLKLQTIYSCAPNFLRCSRGIKYNSTYQDASYLHPVDPKLHSEMQELQSFYAQLSCQDTIPTERDVEKFFSKCLIAAQSLSVNFSCSKLSKTESASALLALNHSKPKQNIFQASSNIESMIISISELSFSIIKHPNVFFSPKVLKMYVAVQALLGWPDTLPEALHLYSRKPVLLKNKKSLRYSKPNPNILTNAIPPDIAKAALEVAIKAKKLVVAIDIIEAAYTCKAYKSSKFVRQALVPTFLFTITPFAIYTLASHFSNWQTSMDAHTARNVAFLGMMAYLGLTGTVGFIAISTSNDQMNRVTWAPGVPLRQRWIREDERAAIDLVASAWGFRESWRRGEEEGEEWDLIKEWVSRRAMILDRVELMEGMN
ncbi:hypothetical protein HI914_01819 [Erysiphe necator]|nr:hypothetical protein HI914_01819 [Erysiphe necator]